MPLTTPEIQSLIAVNIPNNSQQLITPTKVREVLLAMQEFADFQRTTGDTLEGVMIRGNVTTAPLILLSTGSTSVGVQFDWSDGTTSHTGELLLPDGGPTESHVWYLPDAPGTLATQEWVIENTGGGGGGPIALDNLTDVTLTSPATGQLLRYNGTAWVNWTPTFAAGTHTHAISDVTGLQAALDDKAPMSHAHFMADIIGLDTALAGKAAVSHTHIIADVTGLQTALDGKQAAGSYAAATHTHGLGDITGFPSQTGNSGKYLTTDGTNLSWSTVAGGGGVTTMAAVGSSPNANGASISGTTLTLQPASASHPGVVTTGAQTFAGGKTFSSVITTTLATSTDANTGTASVYLRDGGAGGRVGIGKQLTSMHFFAPTDSSSFRWYLGGDFNNSATDLMTLTSASLTLGSGISFYLSEVLTTRYYGGATANTGTPSIYLRDGGAGQRIGIGKDIATVHFFSINDYGFRWYGGGDFNTGASNWAYMDQNGFALYGSNAASAALTITSTTRGFLMPRMTKTQRNAISSPAAGLLVVATDETAANAISRYTGSAWAGAESDNWVDYSSTTTVTGWSSTTVKIVRYQMMHRKVLVQFDIQGTSNSGTTSFTLPFSIGASGVTTLGPFACIDLGGAQIGYGAISGSTVSFSRYVAVDDGGSFTASGTKGVRGQFFLELD